MQKPEAVLGSELCLAARPFPCPGVDFQLQVDSTLLAPVGLWRVWLPGNTMSWQTTSSSGLPCQGSTGTIICQNEPTQTGKNHPSSSTKLSSCSQRCTGRTGLTLGPELFLHLLKVTWLGGLQPNLPQMLHRGSLPTLLCPAALCAPALLPLRLQHPWSTVSSFPQGSRVIHESTSLGHIQRGYKERSKGKVSQQRQDEIKSGLTISQIDSPREPPAAPAMLMQCPP